MPQNHITMLDLAMKSAGIAVNLGLDAQEHLHFATAVFAAWLTATGTAADDEPAPLPVIDPARAAQLATLGAAVGAFLAPVQSTSH